MATNYICSDGETILDVCVNATGTPNNLEAIISANNFNTWCPELTQGQIIIIPDNVEMQPNNLLFLNNNPVSDCGFIAKDTAEQLLNELNILLNEMITQTDMLETYPSGANISFDITVWFSNGVPAQDISISGLPSSLTYTVKDNTALVSGAIDEAGVSTIELSATCLGVDYTKEFTLTSD